MYQWNGQNVQWLDKRAHLKLTCPFLASGRVTWREPLLPPEMTFSLMTLTSRRKPSLAAGSHCCWPWGKMNQPQP